MGAAKVIGSPGDYLSASTVYERAAAALQQWSGTEQYRADWRDSRDATLAWLHEATRRLQQIDDVQHRAVTRWGGAGGHAAFMDCACGTRLNAVNGIALEAAYKEHAGEK